MTKTRTERMSDEDFAAIGDQIGNHGENAVSYSNAADSWEEARRARESEKAALDALEKAREFLARLPNQIETAPGPLFGMIGAILKKAGLSHPDEQLDHALKELEQAKVTEARVAALMRKTRATGWLDLEELADRHKKALDLLEETWRRGDRSDWLWSNHDHWDAVHDFLKKAGRR